MKLEFENSSCKFGSNRIRKALILLTLCSLSIFLCGYGPERPSYTLEEINSGALGESIAFNSISDNPYLGHEFNFVMARKQVSYFSDRYSEGANNTWSANTIEVERGEQYYISLYVHNNSPLGMNAVAKDVRVFFVVPSETGRSIKVSGLIQSSNSDPSEIWDEVTFTSHEDFNLVYVEGSAHLENNGVGSQGTGGISLRDDIVTNTGTLIGYEELDGNIPGCFQYDGYVRILVRPQFADENPTIINNYTDSSISITGDNGVVIAGQGVNLVDQGSLTPMPDMNNPTVAFIVAFSAGLVLLLVPAAIRYISEKNSARTKSDISESEDNSTEDSEVDNPKEQCG